MALLAARYAFVGLGMPPDSFEGCTFTSRSSRAEGEPLPGVFVRDLGDDGRFGAYLWFGEGLELLIIETA